MHWFSHHIVKVYSDILEEHVSSIFGVITPGLGSAEVDGRKECVLYI